jgi:lipopolysaccharide/colanic/teichoic acid biosynthesis glycosyltransferase
MQALVADVIPEVTYTVSLGASSGLVTFDRHRFHAPSPAALGPAKRAFDIVVAALLLVLLAPVLLVAAVAIVLDSRGPVFYRQQRIGRDGVPFRMLKLRSMVTGADAMVADLADRNESDGLLFKIANDPRVTRVGAVIRRLSIDEVPQLVNVLRGEMSIVGPRPLPVSVDAFGEHDRRRLAARPGITGPWQTAGRSRLGYADMVALDLAYLRECSLAADLRILVRTVPAVLRGAGAW